MDVDVSSGEPDRDSENDIQKLRTQIEEGASQLLSNNAELENFLFSLNKCMKIPWNDVFVVPLPRGDKVLLEKLKPEMALCKAFTKCLLTHLVFVLSRKHSKKSQSLCIQFISSLFSWIQVRDFYFFRELSTDFIELMDDLMQVYDHFKKVIVNQTELKFLWFKPDFTDVKKEKLILKQLAVTFSDIGQCNALRCAVSEITSQLYTAVHFHPNSLLKCWKTLCCYLETGNNELQQVTFEALAHLLNLNKIPDNLKIQEYLFDCFRAFFDMTCSGKIALFDNLTALEKSFSNCLNELFEIEKWRWHYYLNKITLFNFFKEFLQIINKHGLANITTNELKQTICELQLYLFNQLPKCDKSLREKLIESSSSAIIHRFITHCDYKWSVQCIFELLKEEINLNTYKINQLTKEKKNNTSSTSEFLSGSNNDRDNDLTIVDAAVLSQAWSNLQTKYQTIIQNLRENNFAQMEKELTELQIIVAIGIISTTTIKINDQPVNKYGLRWFKEESPNVLCHVCYQLLCSLPTAKVYSTIVNVIAAVICAQDKFNVLDVWPKVTAILSLPWVKLLSNCDNTNIQYLRTLVNECGRIEFNDFDTLRMCLWSLAVLPTDVATNLRIYVFRGIILGNNLDHQKLCLEVYHLFLRQMRHQLREDSINILASKMSNFNSGAQLAIAKNLGPIFCILTEETTLNRNKFSKFYDGGFLKSLEVECQTCNSKNVTNDTNPPRAHINDKSFLWQFMNFTSNDDKDIKLALIQSFKSVSSHISIDSRMLISLMALMEDTNIIVRKSFSHEFPSCVKYIWKDPVIQDVILQQFAKAFETAHNSEQSKTVNTLLELIGKLGKIVDKELLQEIVHILVDNLITGAALRSSTAFIQLRGIASAKGISLMKLYLQFNEEICKLLSTKMSKLQKQSEVVTMLNTMASTFEFGNTKTFLNYSMKYLLPRIITQSNNEQLLKLFSDETGMNKSTLLSKHFVHIYVHLICYCPSETSGNALVFIERESEMKIGQLIRNDFQRLLNEFLLRISTHYTQVCNGLVLVASRSGDITTEIKTKEELADFIQPKLLGFLAFVDCQLQTSSTPTEEIKLILQGLIGVIKLMGEKHITPVRMKFLPSLRSALEYKDPELIDLTCTAWWIFVQNVNETALGPLLSQIVVSLIPLIEIKPKEIGNIFHYCIVDKKNIMKPYFNDLYLIPDKPELTELNAVNEVLNAYSVKPNSQQDFLKILRHSLRTISHENLGVRTEAFKKLKNILRTYKDAIYELILSSESLDPIILELVKTMVAGCRETDKDVRSLIGECLGELGAIDPGRLGTNNFGIDISKVCNIDNENFVFELIQELSTAYLRAHSPRVQDCCSYAMQELLQIYKPLKESKLWDKFSQLVKDILTPLFSTKYAEAPIKPIRYPQPIYGSIKDQTFKHWVCTWCGCLVSKIKQENAIRVFNACRLIIKYDFNTALFILPYALLNVLLYSSDDDTSEALQEVLSVLNNKNMDESKRTDLADLFHMSTQTVFSVLDFLKVWVQKTISLPKTTTSVNYMVVQNFLDKIPQDLLIKSSYECQAYPRALMNCEMLIKNSNRIAESHFEILQKLYISLYEPDAVAGLAAIRDNKLKLSDQILLHESTGQFQDAFTCYERAIFREPNELVHYEGILKTFMSLGQPSTALNYANGIIAKRCEWGEALNRFRVEAAWKLSDWSGLESFLKNEDNFSNPGVAVGQILLSAKQKDEEKFFQLLKDARVSQMGPLSAAGMENYAYQRGYEYLIRLHMLNEVEKGTRIFLNFPTTSSSSLTDPDLSENPLSLIHQWNTRLMFTQSSLHGTEPILSLRRVIFDLAKESLPDYKDVIHQQIGYSWLLSAKIARKSGNMQHAYSCLLEASSFNLKETFMQTAKWYWSKLEKEQAILSLQTGLEDHYSDLKTAMSSENKLSYAKAKLLLARYSEESGSVESQLILKMFKEVQNIYPEWEDAHFYLAQYFDRIFNSMETKSKNWDMITRIVSCYSKSLQFGSHFTYQSMPGMLSVWLDLGAHIVECKKQRNIQTASMEQNLTAINKMMNELIDVIPAYKFLTAFPQLVSRISHSNDGVFLVLKKIIAKLLITYPQQAMWQIVAVLKSSYPKRVSRCKDILNIAENLDKSLKKFFFDVVEFVDRLMDLCNIKVGGNCLNIQTQCPEIQRLLNSKNFSKIMLPKQSAMTVNLPAKGRNDSRHNPFPTALVYIQGIDNLVEIMPSLQRPKKIKMRGTDGRVYTMMCKPKDDLRKDFRLMEFNAIVNKALLRDPEARRRQLHIKTYTVIPLNEECGLIEWVDNLSTLRSILLNLYKKKNIIINAKELKLLVPDLKAKIEEKLRVFKTEYLPRHPSVLSEWFLQNFLDPTAWYLVRLSYTRTLAVMSMVGYILGLGDRHGENILLEQSCGDVMHVDFNCLFNKGLDFEWPEKVPFRLTHNLVDAMGVTGTEGVYKKACEVTLRVMRKQKETLMSVLKPFIHDPLVEWNKGGGGARQTGEIINEQALTHVRDIEQRIKGIVLDKHRATGLPLSIEGQVKHLIQEATSEENLCQMFLGWAAYM